MRKLIPCLTLMFLLAACAGSPYANNPVFAAPESRTTAALWLNRALVDGAEVDTMRRFRAQGLSRVNTDEVRMEWNDVQPYGRDDFKILRRELAFTGIKFVGRPDHQGDFWDVFVDASGGGVTFHFKDNHNAALAEAALRRLMEPVTAAELQGVGRKYCQSLSERGEVSADWAEASLQVLTDQDFGQKPDRWLKWFDSRP
ncbi:hypothetical protein OAU50_02355 [Planctomycetota bacterium]|nr:hypothetical protein [Planctomycetota bacterium]